MRRLLAIVPCAAGLLCTPPHVESQPTGCYAIAYGPWFPDVLYQQSQGEDETAPRRFELRSEIDTGAHSDSARFVSAVPRESPRKRSLFPTVWRRIGRDSIRVDWDPGTVKGTIYLGGQTSFVFAVSPDTLRGLVDFETDQIPLLGQPWAKVLAVRIPCAPADTLVWHQTAEPLSAWSRSQPVDTTLAIRHALAGFARVRSDTVIEPMPFSDFIRVFYARHGRFPRTTREAYLIDDPVFRLLPPEVFLSNTAGTPYRFVPHGQHFDVIDDGPPKRVWRHISVK